MFDRAIIETDNFLNISLSAKALYFLLGMEADDEGFVSPTRVIRLYGGEGGDIKNLIDSGLIIPFKSGVVVITDWKANNYLDINRVKDTVYQQEKNLLLTCGTKYEFNGCLTDVKPIGYEPKESLGEAKPDTAEGTFNQFWLQYPKKELKKKSLEIWKRKKYSRHIGEILSFIEGAKLSDRWRKGFIKQPPAFLNGECWTDDLSSYQDRKSESSIINLKVVNLKK